MCKYICACKAQTYMCVHSTQKTLETHTKSNTVRKRPRGADNTHKGLKTHRKHSRHAKSTKNTQKAPKTHQKHYRHTKNTKFAHKKLYLARTTTFCRRRAESTLDEQKVIKTQKKHKKHTRRTKNTHMKH